MTMTTLALGKHPRELHAKIVAMVTIVEATKQRDFSGRLKSELVYTMYVNPIAVLCIEVYKLEIPLLTSPDVRAPRSGLYPHFFLYAKMYSFLPQKKW